MTRISCPWASFGELQVITELYSLFCSGEHNARSIPLRGHCAAIVLLRLGIIQQSEMGDSERVFLMDIEYPQIIFVQY